MSPIQESQLKSPRWVAYGFFALVTIAEGCLFPYLTIYFKHIGLSAIQTGIIRAVQSFLSVWSIALWVQCATRFHVHRIIILVSLLFSILAFVSVVLVSPLETTDYLSNCNYSDSAVQIDTENGDYQPTENVGTVVPFNSRRVPSMTKVKSIDKSRQSEQRNDYGMGKNYLFDQSVNENDESKTRDEKKSGFDGFERDLPEDIAIDKSPDVRGIRTEFDKENRFPDGEENSDWKQTQDGSNNIRVDKLPDIRIRVDDDKFSKENPYSDGEETADWKQNQMDTSSYYDDEEPLPRTNFKKTKRSVDRLGENPKLRRNIDSKKCRGSYEVSCDPAMSSNSAPQKIISKRETDLQSSNDYESIIQTESKTNTDSNTFWDQPSKHTMDKDFFATFKPMYWILLLLMAIGSIFGSPALTTADRAWYSYLDDLDLTEKYGHHQGFCLFFTAVATLITSIAVAFTPCRLMYVGDHFNFHFFVYGFALAIAVIMTFCFPVVSSKFSLALPQTSIISEFRHLHDDHGLILVTLTALLVAALSACTQDFLLWTIEDAGGNEIHFGCAIALGFVAEMFAPTISRYLLPRKMKLYPILITSLLFFALRLLAFSFIWTPWFALIGQLFHFGSACAIPAVISAYVSHSSCRAIYRTNVVPALLLMGRTIGSGLSGIAYDLLGFQTTFQSASGVALVWSGILLIIYKCMLNKAKPYAKLIHSQDIADGTLGDSETDEDWLDDALKKPPPLATSA